MRAILFVAVLALAAPVHAQELLDWYVAGGSSSPANMCTTDTTQTISGAKSFSAVVLGPNGTAGAPSWSFINDSDTGMYRRAADEIGWSTAGTAGWSMDSSQMLKCNKSAGQHCAIIKGTIWANDVGSQNYGFNNVDTISFSGLGIGTTVGVTLGNTGTRIQDSYAASASIDFAGVTDACEDSSGITVTGAEVNDGCVVGPPASLPSANSWFFCYVSAADTVKVRHCAHGASGNPAAATYTVRVLDP